MDSQKMHKNPQALPHNLLNNKSKIGLNGSYQKTHDWVAVYIDDKFFLTTQSAFERVQTLDYQIAQEKEKLQKLNLDNEQKKEGFTAHNRQIPIKQNIKRKNSLESAQSRQCKTEINELKALKAKFQIQRQLIEEQMNFQNKTLQVRKRRELKEATTFLIRNPREKSSQYKQIRPKKSNKNNYMLAPHELSNSNRKNQQKQYGKEIQPFNEGEDEQGVNYKTINQNISKNEKSEQESHHTVKISENSHYRYQEISQNKKQVSKSKQKSFVITSRKQPSTYSKQQKDSSFRENSKRSSYHNSQAQLQKLNNRLKQMQKKLISVQKKQKQIQEMQKQKQTDQKQDRTESLQNFYSINNETVGNNGKTKAQPNYKKKKIEKYFKREQKQKDSQKESMKNEKKQEQVKKNERETIFAIREQKYKRLGITSETVAYNYNEQKERNEKQNEKENDDSQVKQKMSREIQELKKTIKQLKIEKIKQETVISQLERKDKRNIKENESEENNNNEITFNGQDLYSRSNIKSHSNTNSIAFSEKSMLQSISQKQEELIQQIKQDDLETTEVNQNKPLNKKQPRRILKFDVNSVYKKKLSTSLNNSYHQRGFNGVSIHYQGSKQQNAERKLSQNNKTSAALKNSEKKIEQKKYENPEQQTKQSAMKGKIVKQNFNRHKIQSMSSNNQSQKEIGFEFNHTNQKEHEPYISNSPETLCLKEEFSYPQIIVPEIQSIQSFPIPELPSPPSLQTQQSEILTHAKKICQIFQIKIKSNEQLQFKKFKNCILLKTLSNNKAIVWHFSGKFYIGGWEQKSQSGQDHKNGEGFQFIPQKHYYRGQFLRGKKNGYGTMIMLNGNIYKGQWENGEKNGKGILYEKMNNSYYDGDWKGGKKEGKGIYKISDKQFYIGTFQNSLKEGYGFQLFGNGDVYEGCYKNGKFNGKGKYFWANGSAYVGQFVDGQRSGQGKWISSLHDGDLYIGNYQKDRKQGKGKYIWFTGCIFEGNFLGDLKHGEGKVDYPDGRQVKGVWQYGKLKNIYKSQYQGQSRIDEQIFYQQIEPRIRPNIPRIEETPSKMMQQSRLIHGV